MRDSRIGSKLAGSHSPPGTMNKICRRLGAPALVAAVLIVPDVAHAGTCTWNGSASGNWSNAANWNLPCTTPQAGDDLVFPDAASGKAMVDDIANLSVASLSFTGSGGGYVLTGTGNLTITGANAIS